MDQQELAKYVGVNKSSICKIEQGAQLPSLLTTITVNKVISPEENQTDDSWLFFYRAYGLADVYENKAAGIYLHHKA